MTPGTMEFNGTQTGNVYEGTAYVFSRTCGAIGFAVSGSVAQDAQSITMKGWVPYIDLQCRRVGGHPGVPNLKHTKVLDAFIDGDTIAKANWNSVLEQMLIRAIKLVGTFDKLRQLFPVNLVKGRKEDEGYRYLSDINVSVQGQDANAAGGGIVTAAQGLGTALEVGFMWRHKEGAAHPGERARIMILTRRGVSAA